MIFPPFCQPLVTSCATHRTGTWKFALHEKIFLCNLYINVLWNMNKKFLFSFLPLLLLLLLLYASIAMSLSSSFKVLNLTSKWGWSSPKCGSTSERASVRDEVVAGKANSVHCARANTSHYEWEASERQGEKKEEVAVSASCIVRKWKITEAVDFTSKSHNRRQNLESYEACKVFIFFKAENYQIFAYREKL